jgi:peroxiredoxin
MYQEYGSKLTFLSIDTGEAASKAKAYMETNGFTFKTVLVDAKGDVALKYGVQYLPTTIIIDETGIIKLLKVGAFTATGS